MPSKPSHLLTLLSLASLAQSRLLQDSGLGNAGCIASFKEGENYFSTIFSNEPFALPVSLNTTITDAYNFRVEYNDYYKTVKDTHAKTTYYLYLCGAPKPNVAPGVANGTFEIPLTSFGIRTTVPANYLQLLGKVEEMKRVSDPVVDPCLQKHAASLKQNGTLSFSGAMIDAGFGGGFTQPNISFSASQDEGVLNRAEWIKYLALFFNAEDRAAAVFNNITAAYNCVKGAVPAVSQKRTGAWLGFYNNTWTLGGAAYKRQYVSDAGGESPKESNFGDVTYNMSIPQNVSAFHDMLRGVDVVFDETFLKTGPASYSFANFSENAKMEAQEQGRLMSHVWSVYGTYAPGEIAYTAWYESALSNPQVVLEEILVALYPDVTPAGFSNTYLFNVHHGKAKEMTAADCTASNPAQMVDPSPTLTCSSKSAAISSTTPPSLTPSPKGAASCHSWTALVVVVLALLASLAVV